MTAPRLQREMRTGPATGVALAIIVTAALAGALLECSGLHVTDTAPTDRPYETVRYDPNVNVVPNVLPPGTPPRHD